MEIIIKCMTKPLMVSRTETFVFNISDLHRFTDQLAVEKPERVRKATPHPEKRYSPILSRRSELSHGVGLAMKWLLLTLRSRIN